MKHVKFNSSLTALSCLLMPLLINGCASCNDHLIFATGTRLGVDVSASGNKITQASLGYTRGEGMSMPVDPDSPEIVARGGQVIPADSRPIFAGVNADNSWLGGLKTTQVFATGPAAVEAAKSKDTGIARIMGYEAAKDAANAAGIPVAGAAR
jgi:hypothetical protein